MKAVAYIRVSTDEQVQGTSLVSQEKACREYAKRQGWELPDENIFRDEGESAKYADRPQLLAMVEHCRKNKGTITKCIVWKLDRFARNAEDHMTVSAILRRLGVALCSVTEPINDSASGRLMEIILAGFAEFDNSVRTARTTGGMRARTMQGGWPHSAPFGYKKARTATGITTLALDDANAEKAKLFLEEFSVGAYTVKQAADLALKFGIKSNKGQKRSWQVIKNMISNPLYAGNVSTKYTDGQIIKGMHPAIISERTFYRNQAILSGNLKNFSRQAEEEWPLRSGFLKHACGKAMTGSAPRGRNGPSPRYSCPTCRASVLKIPVSKQRELVHADFMELMKQVRPNEGTKRLFKEIALRKWNEEFKEALQLSSKLESELTALRNKKGRILDMFIDGQLTEEEKTTKIRETEKAIGLIHTQRHDADRYVNEKESIVDGALLFMSDPDLFWNIGSIEIKKRIQDSIFPDGLTYDCEAGFGTATLSESYLLISDLAQTDGENPTLVAATGIEPVT